MQLSVVSTMYRSAPYLREFHARVTATVRQVTNDYEIVLVNDGSPDDSLAIALELQAADPHVRIVDLSRNFGHHQAMWTGLGHARGEWIYLIDCDLEESPEWLLQFREEQEKTGADVIFGVQKDRGGRMSGRVGGWLFYKLFNLLSDQPIPRNLMTVRLMSRRYVEALLSHTESTFIIAGLWARTGFTQVPVWLDKLHKRQTTYSPWRRAKMFVNALTSFSSQPLVAIFYLGLAIFIVAGLFASGLVLQRILGTALSGWPSLMVSIWFLGGLIILCQGIIGVYLAKVYNEVKRRPVAIVRQVFERDSASSAERPPSLGRAAG